MRASDQEQTGAAATHEVMAKFERIGAGALGLIGAVALAFTGTISLRELVVQLLTVPLLSLAIWWLALRSGIVASPDEAQQATGERRPP